MNYTHTKKRKKLISTHSESQTLKLQHTQHHNLLGKGCKETSLILAAMAKVEKGTMKPKSDNSFVVSMTQTMD